VKVLITGADGQLGQHLLRCAPNSLSVVGMSRAECDITRVEALRNAFRDFEPNVVINAAAYTSVDKAETNQKQAIAVNVRGAANVGAVSSEFSTRTIHLSTDYVFDGNASTPYPPGARTCPLNVYGRTKLEGEGALSAANANSLIVRTGWLYSTRQETFVGKIISRLKSGREVRVVEDQVGVPTSAADLATAIWSCVRTPSLRGIQHWVNSGTASWYEFAVRIRERAGKIGLLRAAPLIVAIPSSAFISAAARPRYSVLDASAAWAALGHPARDWREALEEVLRELVSPPDTMN
jgi:dTDP-4-dehydrorhamnose reductase